MMDPPWQLATANPTRGVALGYSQLTGQQGVSLAVVMLGSREQLAAATAAQRVARGHMQLTVQQQMG